MRTPFFGNAASPVFLALLALPLLLLQSPGRALEASESDGLRRAQSIEEGLVDALKRVEPASVTIVGKTRLSRAALPGEAAPYVVNGAGSGVLISWNGTWILTNAHVVDHPGRMEAVLADGRSIPIRVHARNKDYDLALARFASHPAGARPVRVPRPSSAHTAVGTWVSAAGNPFMLALDGKSVANLGVISGLRPAEKSQYVEVATIQHDAEVNPGNSGGPLWNLQGELIGINGSIATYSQDVNNGASYTGASFAIPLQAIHRFLTEQLGPDRGLPVRPSSGSSALRDVQTEYKGVIQQVMPCVAVCVPRGVQGRSAGFSSAVIVHENGLVLSDGDAGLVWTRYRDERGRRISGRRHQDSVDVRIWHPRSRTWRSYKGRVVFRDTDVDTSLIQLEEFPPGGIERFVIPGRSTALRTGDICLAVGSSYDEQSRAPPALTAGIVSTIDDRQNGHFYTTAGVNKGLNGGAIVDLRGRLIGTMSNYVEPSAETPYGYLGKVVPIDRALAAMARVPEARPLLQQHRGRVASQTGGAGLESVLHAAGRRVRSSLVSLSVDRRRPIDTQVPLERKTVKLTRYQGTMSGIVAGPDLVVTSLYNLTNVGQRIHPLWTVPSGASIDEGLADIRALRVHTADGRTLEATLVGHDIRWGFALLRTRGGSPGAIPRIAPDDAHERGRFVVAAGDPFGSRRPADPLLTTGILSKYHPLATAAPWRGMWQTDAGAVDGNAGGAAVDLQGRLLGMQTLWHPSKHGRNSGIGFVVPWSRIQTSVARLLRGETPERGMIGIYFQTDGAAMIGRISSGSAAAKAGLEVGDVIRTVDGVAMPSQMEVYESIAHRMAGERVRLGILRNGALRQVTVTLGGFTKD